MADPVAATTHSPTYAVVPPRVIGAKQGYQGVCSCSWKGRPHLPSRKHTLTSCKDEALADALAHSQQQTRRSP